MWLFMGILGLSLNDVGCDCYFNGTTKLGCSRPRSVLPAKNITTSRGSSEFTVRYLGASTDKDKSGKFAYRQNHLSVACFHSVFNILLLQSCVRPFATRGPTHSPYILALIGFLYSTYDNRPALHSTGHIEKRDPSFHALL
jgi:hypothetical protein